MIALNTKPVGYAGVLAFILGLLTYGPFQAALTTALGAQATQWAGLVFIVAGFAGAYYGMPHVVPTPAPAAAPADAPKGP